MGGPRGARALMVLNQDNGGPRGARALMVLNQDNVSERSKSFDGSKSG